MMRRRKERERRMKKRKKVKKRRKTVQLSYTFKPEIRLLEISILLLVANQRSSRLLSMKKCSNHSEVSNNQATVSMFHKRKLMVCMESLLLSSHLNTRLSFCKKGYLSSLTNSNLKELNSKNSKKEQSHESNKVSLVSKMKLLPSTRVLEVLAFTKRKKSTGMLSNQRLITCRNLHTKRPRPSTMNSFRFSHSKEVHSFKHALIISRHQISSVAVQ